MNKMTSTESALTRFNNLGAWDEPDPVERLRFFLSLALSNEDWLDVEQFIDAMSLPEGRVIVPVEPTDTMIDEVCESHNMYRVDVLNIWDSLLNAWATQSLENPS